ncbi:MAG: hypothetical protein AB7I50_04030 [Vicinamibacterales bacterium]
MTAPDTRTHALLLILFFMFMFAAAVLGRQGPARAPADRRLDMHDHFSQVDLIQTAVIRGDLEAVWEPARWLSKHALAVEATALTEPLLHRVAQTSARAAEASSLHEAAQAVATLTALCGACHEASGTQVAIPIDKPVAVGGIVGHMNDHLRAVAELQSGLIEPSATFWAHGVRTLETAPLKRSKLPRDRLLSEAIVSAEADVHQLAGRARAATTLEQRAAVFGDLLARCADCHGLHGRVWGPGLPEQ